MSSQKRFIPNPNKMSDIEIFDDLSNDEEIYLDSYNNFDKEDSTNFIFLVKKSNCPQFPLGSYIYGVIQPNKTDVILYKDRECTLKA